MNPLNPPLVWKFQKHSHLLHTQLFRSVPEFVYRRLPRELEGEIPVFVFHAVDPDVFEDQCRYLAENGYKTLSADEFMRAMSDHRRVPKKEVVLSFDDGLRDVWTVAFPLLRKYGLNAVCFLIPGLIEEGEDGTRPTLQDCWEGRLSQKEVLQGREGDSPLATWSEIRIMHQSGVVDFQSHTMYHALVFTSDKIIDFVNPRYDPYFYGNIHIPLYSVNGHDRIEREPLPGMPIYRGAPRMTTGRRFFDDERVRDACIDAVAREGASEFFQSRGWRRRLRRIAIAARRRGGGGGRYEAPEEGRHAIRSELEASKRIIEEKLPGKVVSHLCFPWFVASPEAVQLAEDVGYRACYFGYSAKRSGNRPGDDLFGIVRVDDMYVHRLPGSGRKSVAEILWRVYAGR